MDLGGTELDQLMEQTRAALQAMRTTRPQESTARGHGHAAGGKVVVEATGGRISRIDLDTSVMTRMRAADLADQIMTAVNQALDDVAKPSPEDERIAGIDTEHLERQLTDIQLQSVRQMAAIGDAIQMVLRQARGQM